MTSFSAVSNRTELRLSPSLAAGLIAAAPWFALGLATLAMASQGPAALALLAPLALAGGLVQFHRCGLLRGRGAIVGLSLLGNELWAQLGDGRQLPVTPSPDSRLGGRLALVKVSSPAVRLWSRTLVLVHYGDSCSNVEPEPFRQLRVWLRLRSPR
ncbi:hypothetical protein [Marinobacter sp. SS21]|uniref:hypothetical protein n=1 Tax=Marinobacter sp. SS21 TaxID=2979460 RepID=UPI00232BBDD0|nr:hypothetical protein [Marinobacter sp. SS21]MDC0662619.1 hypothetical protein [Marinobacter sp. SS21]